MKCCGRCLVTKELSCFHKSSGSRDGYQGFCKQCSKEKRYAWAKENKAANYEIHKRWQEKNPGFREAYKERERKTAVAYQKANAALYAARASARRAGLAKATPVWVDKAELLAIYKKREEISKLTGIQHHVDHIIPLNGNGVMGLHVPWNLQVIPAKDNMRKNNRVLA